MKCDDPRIDQEIQKWRDRELNEYLDKKVEYEEEESEEDRSIRKGEEKENDE